MRCIVLVSALLLTASIVSSQTCPDGWLGYQQSCYLIVDTPKTWQDARDECRLLQADLASLTTTDEQTWMGTQLGGTYWFGLSDIVTENGWQWADGTVYDPSVTNWGPNEPNNAGNEEDCAEIFSNGLWNDQSCSDTRGYICEKPTGCEILRTDTQYRYRWNLPRLTGDRFEFEVQATNDVHVALSSQRHDLANMYEIVIGGWGNTQSVIRRSKQGRNHARASTSGINSNTQYRTFWITWSPDGTIAVGRGGETQPFMQWTDPNPLPITFAGYSTGWGSTGLWRFCQNAVCGAETGTCSAWGDPHFTSFDGTKYDFQGPCRYTFTKDCGNDAFVVEVEQVPARWRPSVSIVREVYVIAYGYEIGLLQGKVVTVNGPTRLPSFDLANGKIEVTMSPSFVRVELTELCVVILYNGVHEIKVEVPSNYRNRVCGLCGNYNGIQSDDDKMPDGNFASNWNQFGNSWETDTNTCDGDRPTGEPPTEGPCDESVPCGVLEDQRGPFAVCHGAVDPGTYLETCVFDTCATNGDFLCANLEAYYDSCVRAGVSPFSWRTPDLCPMDCPANSHFSTCTSACPATCVNPSAPDNCNLPCEEGCECDEGYVLSGQECVLQTNCGCIDDEGFYHALGDVWQDDGEMCECLAEDTIVCEGLTRTDLCARPARGICRACGDPHVTMFDGKRHHFQGPCRYTFAKDCGNPSDFTVEVQHVPVPRRPVVSVVREVFVIAHGYEIGIHQGNDVTVNGVLYSVPFTLAMDKIDVRYRGIWVHVRLVEYCVDIFYNGRHCVKVTVTPYYWGRMCGLCGNYNGVMSDDFMMSDLETIALNWNDFGDSWLVEDEDDERCGGHPPPPTCPPGLLTTVSANDMCGLITDTDGPFAGCHGCVDPLDFFNDCVFDMCAQDGEIEGLCENLEAYADACEDDGVAIAWRTSTRCPLPCPPNSHYNPCTSICPPTCQHPLPDLACVGCVECCECDPGYVMSGPHCVPLEECGCTDPDTGRYYELGETWVEDGERCICRKNNKIICKGCSFDIVFILDRSSSIGPYGMYIAEKYIAHIIKCLYGLDVDVGYIVFDCISTWLISLGLYNVDTSGLIPKIKAAEFTGGESRAGHAIYHMMCTANYRNGIPSAAVVLTDGFAYKEYPSNLYEIQSDAARAMGIELYAVAVGRDPLFNFNGLANIAGGSDRVFDRYSCCALAIRLMEDLCVACDVSSDLFFVLDGSGSVGPDNFETVKQFVVDVVSAFTISLTDTRVGVVQYSHFNTLACNLGDHPDEASFVTAINTMQHQDGGTTTGNAMDFARQEANWRDAPTPRIMIVLTDGKSADDVVAAAQALAADGVTVYAIGVANFDTAELLEITNGNQDRVIELKDYTALTASINSIVKALCIDNDPCEKAVDPGPCKAYFPRWYFNSQTGQCEQFIYGGCLGNDNNFVTEQECQNTCVPTDPCEQAVDPGPCRGSFPRWYFNSQTGQCEQFIYGGCLGNDNNFVTEQECQNTCGPTDPCEQAVDPGPCRAYIPRWYFNSQTGQCEQFIYGGCDGNGNNFETEQECQNTCGPTDPCEQAMDPGPCEAIFPRWYFNSQTGQCEQFIYGGCDGNGNNFVTVEECQDTCGVTTVG